MGNEDTASYLCRVLPGQYRSTAGSTGQKLIVHSGCLSCFLYKAKLDLLTVWSQNRDVPTVQRLTLRFVSKGEMGRFPRTPWRWLFPFFFFAGFFAGQIVFFFFLSFFPLVLTTRLLLPLSLTLCPSAPNHNRVFPFQIPSLSHR